MLNPFALRPALPSWSPRGIAPILLSVGLLLGGLAGAPLRGATEEELLKRFRAGNDKVNAQAYAEAIEIYNEILEQAPKSENVLVHRAIAKWGLKDLSGARADFAQALSLNPATVGAYQYRSMLRFQTDDPNGSLADLNEAIKLEPANAEFFEMRGEVNLRLQIFSDALSDFSRAIELNPKLSAAYLQRANLRRDSEDDAGALSDYSKVIELTPDAAVAWTERGWVKFRALDLAGALADALKAAEVLPEFADAWSLAGYARFGLGQYPAAVAALTQAASLNKAAEAYPVIIRHFALQRTAGVDERLATSWPTWKTLPWTQAVARFITGQISEDELEAKSAEADDENTKLGQQCEAHFYIGLIRLQAGDKSTARLRFRSAVDIQALHYTERTLAAFELKRL
jgi:tetratricopeptide (TPR) repeat protein